MNKNERTEERTEVEEALRIARDLRDNILTEKGSTNTNILGFLTVAQILGREQDLNWIKYELKGFDSEAFGMIPDYRKGIVGDIMTKDGDDYVGHNYDAVIYEGILRLIESLDNSKRSYDMVADKNLEEEIRNKFKVSERDTFYTAINRSVIAHVVDLMKVELLMRLNSMISEITYGKILQNIFKRFESKVNNELVKTNPNAVSELNMAYENLGASEDPERIAHVAFSCRRLIKSVADELYPAKKGEKVVLKNGNELDIGEERFLNRLEAYVDSLDSPNSEFLIKEIFMLRDIVDEIPENMNKGVHFNISNRDAENLVLYSYIILGDLVLEKSRDYGS